MTRHFNRLSSLFIFAFVFCLYLLTLHPTVAPYRDAGDLAVAAHTLGIAHPPGYPLYTLLGKIADLVLPIANHAYRLNVLSALFGAGCVALLLMTARVLLPGWIGPAAVVLAAFSPAFWRLAQVSEMYSINAFLCALLLFIAARYIPKDAPAIKLVVLAGLVAGMALGNHQTIVLLFPGLLWFLMDTRLRRPSMLSVVGVAVLVFCIGFSVYLFLPLRSLADPVWKWGNPDSWSSFVRMITRADYGGAKLHPGQSTFSWSFDLLIGHCLVYGQSLISQFTLPGALMGFCGIWATRRERFWRFVLISLILAGPGFVILSNLPPAEKTTLPILEAHLVLPNVLFVLFIAAGFSALAARAKLTAGALLAVTAIWSLALHAPVCNYRDHFYAYDYGKNIQRTISPSGMIYDPDDDTDFILSYQQVVNGQRPDIALAAYFRTRWGYELLKQRYPSLLPSYDIASGQELAATLLAYNAPRRPVFADLPSKFPAGTGFETVPHGMMCYLSSGTAAAVTLTPFEFYCMRDKYAVSDAMDFFTAQVVSYYAAGYSNTAMALAARHDFDRAQQAYFAALSIDPGLSPAYNNLGILEYSRGRYAEAEYWYSSLLALSPHNPGALYNLGLVYKAMRRTGDAQRLFESAWQTARSADAGNELGLILLHEGKYSAAADLFTAVKQAHPNFLPAWYNLGLAYRGLGDRANSRRCFEAYAAAVPDPRERAAVSDMLRRL